MNFKQSYLNKLNILYLNIILILLPFFPFNNKTFANEESKQILNSEYLETKNYEEYILSSGDFIYISIRSEIKELNGAYLIDGSGRINIPYLNSIFIKGLTIDELSSLLDEKFSEYIFSPNTKIDIINYRPVRFVIEGEVENPGLHTLAGSYNFKDIKKTNNDLSKSKKFNFTDYSDEPYFFRKLDEGYNTMNSYFPTIFDAIQSSGGITTYSDLSNVEVIRKVSITNGGGFKQTKLNLLDALFKNDMNQNIRILDGDKIIIKKSENKFEEQMSAAYQSNLNPKFNSVFVSGNVRQPGEKIVTKKSTLNDAIALSGGRLPMSGNIFLIRYENNGEQEEFLQN